MKLLASILSVYFLLLTVTPCVDLPNDNCSHRTMLSQYSDHHNQGDVDLCSPFCTCNCCSSPITYSAEILNVKCLVFSQTQHSEYTLAYLSLFFDSIWQPPKLS